METKTPEQKVSIKEWDRKMKYIKAIMFMMLAVLAADLIYLYSVGGWYDTPLIETIELVLLIIFIPVGVGLAIWEVSDPK